MAFFEQKDETIQPFNCQDLQWQITGLAELVCLIDLLEKWGLNAEISVYGKPCNPHATGPEPQFMSHQLAPHLVGKYVSYLAPFIAPPMSQGSKNHSHFMKP